MGYCQKSKSRRSNGLLNYYLRRSKRASPPQFIGRRAVKGVQMKLYAKQFLDEFKPIVPTLKRYR